MSQLLKITLMLLGAVVVLLFAGGFPPHGVPGIYHGGAMLLAGAATCVLCLWGAWRLAVGNRLRMVLGVLCAAWAGVGAIGVWQFGAETCRLAGIGGAMWFGAVGVGCLALIGGLFVVIFGFLAWRVMLRKLWLAALHLCTALALLGAGADWWGGESEILQLQVGASHEKKLPLGDHGAQLSVCVTDFNLTRYDGDESYGLLRHEDGHWALVGAPERRGDMIVWGEESWPVISLVRVAGMPQPFRLLPGKPPRLLMQYEAPVKDYRATCRFSVLREGKSGEVQEEVLRVNHPAVCEGRLFYLMSYRPLGHGGMQVDLLVRRAPGRFLVLLGLIGVVLSTACWCFCPRESAMT